jgi:hypothetical protein
MSDVGPNYRTEQQRLAVQVLEQRLAMSRSALEVMEILDRIEKNRANIVSTLSALDGLKAEQEQAPSALEKQRKKAQLFSLMANVERQTLENLELEERADQIAARSKAEREAKDRFSQQLLALDDAHGKLVEEPLELVVQKCRQGQVEMKES